MTSHVTRHPSTQLGTGSSLVLTGFMGTGKTATGRLVAEKLAREFIDMDALIEARERMSVRAIFETRGEAYFRARESKLCAELAAQEKLVIATGGGTLVDPRNRAAFNGAFIVCLDATAEEIRARLIRVEDRPLLTLQDPQARIEELMNARRAAYAQIQYHIDTTGKNVTQVAEGIIALYQMQKISVPAPESAYSIFVGAELLAHAGTLISNSAMEKLSANCAVVTNSRVGELHAGRAVESLRAAGFEPRVIVIPEGEQSKTLETVRVIYDQLIDARLDRRSIIFALGGGVVGDIAGFAAATFLRGVAFVQLPTTLLAIVDASIGGKVAVDHPRGKNLIGAFKHPHAIIADTDTLATLPKQELRAGMAEVVKHAVIGDAGLFEMLENHPSPLPMRVRENWLTRAIRVKVDIVARDPYEQGERAKLNLGHTFGHALEKLSNYEMRHGDAVAIGLVCATRLAARRNVCDGALAARIEHLLRAIELPTQVPRKMSADAIVSAMATDKKRVGAHLRFSMPRALGDVIFVDNVTEQEIITTIEETRE